MSGQVSGTGTVEVVNGSELLLVQTAFQDSIRLVINKVLTLVLHLEQLLKRQLLLSLMTIQCWLIPHMISVLVTSTI